MQVHRPAAALPASGDDERSLLIRLEQLLDREEAALASRDAIAIAGLAEEREQVTARLGDAAAARCSGARLSIDDETRLMAMYEQLRQRHAVRAQVVHRHAERNARSIGVLAQASGQSALYQSNGRVPLQYGGR